MPTHRGGFDCASEQEHAKGSLYAVPHRDGSDDEAAPEQGELPAAGGARQAHHPNRAPLGMPWAHRLMVEWKWKMGNERVPLLFGCVSMCRCCATRSFTASKIIHVDTAHDNPNSMMYDSTTTQRHPPTGPSLTSGAAQLQQIRDAMERLTQQVLQHARGLPAQVRGAPPQEPPELPPAETVVQHLQRLLQLLMANPLVSPPVVGRRSGGAKAAAAQLQRVLGEGAPLGAPLLRKPAQQLLLQLAELQSRLRGEGDSQPLPLFVGRRQSSLPGLPPIMAAPAALLPPAAACHAVALPSAASSSLRGGTAPPASPPSVGTAPPASPPSVGKAPPAPLIVLCQARPTIDIPAAAAAVTSLTPKATDSAQCNTAIMVRDVQGSQQQGSQQLGSRQLGSQQQGSQQQGSQQQDGSHGSAKSSATDHAPAPMNARGECEGDASASVLGHNTRQEYGDAQGVGVLGTEEEPGRLPDHGWKEVRCSVQIPHRTKKGETAKTNYSCKNGHAE